jgi:hypothetical protein
VLEVLYLTGRSGVNVSTTAKPGWYPSPERSDRLRYWDGQAWTEHEQPQPPLSEPGAPPAPNTISFAEYVNERLREACDQAAAGDVVAEERTIADLLRFAKKNGSRKVLRGVEQEISRLEATNQLRIDSEIIGTIQPEGALRQYARLERLASVRPGGAEAIIRTDRILHGSDTYPITADTGAQVILDGEILITQRPTLTRMALLSPLPGTALIPGLALQKRTKRDQRTAEFIAASATWSFSIPIDPDDVSHPRQIAERINRIATAKETSALTSQTTPGSLDTVAALHGIKQLHDDGFIDAAEAELLKHEILQREGSNRDQ